MPCSLSVEAESGSPSLTRITEADKIIDISSDREDLKQNEKFGLDKKLKPKLINSVKMFNSIIKDILIKTMSMLSLTN